MEASGIQQVKDAEGPKGCSVLLRSDSFHTDANVSERGAIVISSSLLPVLRLRLQTNRK